MSDHPPPDGAAAEEPDDETKPPALPIDWGAAENARIVLLFTVLSGVAGGLSLGAVGLAGQEILAAARPHLIVANYDLLAGFFDLLTVGAAAGPIYLVAKLLPAVFELDPFHPPRGPEMAKQAASRGAGSLYLVLVGFAVLAVQVAIGRALGADFGGVFFSIAYGSVMLIASYQLAYLLKRYGRLKPDATPGAEE